MESPDLTCIGKAMANGYPISAVTGKSDIMKTGEKEVFVSSTFFPNSLPYIASLKTIEILECENVLEKIWEKGGRFFKRLKKVVESSNVGAELSGIAPMFFITFEKDAQKTDKEKRRSFYTQLIRRGHLHAAISSWIYCL